MRTYQAKPLELTRKWHLIDAKGKTVGRLATQVATLLRGKHKPIFTPHLDTGDHVVVVNARNVKVTGNLKPLQMKYYHYSGYPGGLKETTFEKMLLKKPEEVFRLAVRRMLPKNRLGRILHRKECC